MNAPDLDQVLEKLTSRGFHEVALKYVRTKMEQVRFSQNTKDLYNDWKGESLSIFASRGKKTVSTKIGNLDIINDTVEKLWDISGKVPDNPHFEGLNPEVGVFSPQSNSRAGDYDIQDLASSLINSATENGADRTAGVVYNRNHEVSIKTNYNECTYETGGLELLIRSFKNELTGQEARHFGNSVKVDSSMVEHIGMESAKPLTVAKEIFEIRPGLHEALISPYVIGNIISYSSDFLSYYSVESGLSCFSDKLDSEVSSEEFSLIDDPLDRSGVGFKTCDDEGTPTRRTTLIEDGVLMSYLHSHSTAARTGERTTANAGILYPTAWQLKIPPGNSSPEELLSRIDEGLWINNCWYTRYQDQRNGVFSTVPRDGVYYVKNGEVQGIVKGIRISDSIPSILSNVSAVSNDVKSIKWWEEISPSLMPSVLLDEVKISRGF